MESTLSTLLLFAWLLPLASFVLILFFGQNMGKAGKGAGYVATGAILVGFLLSLIALFNWVGNHGVGEWHRSGTHHEEGGRRKPHTNIRTEQEFEDFNLTLETRTLKGSNSGVYLRGIYEVQVFESYGKPVNPHNMGAIYSRITPTVAAEKPIGQWQMLDITLVDRHVTVILNGKTIIDNQPLLGCTGGALWSDPLRPGPIYLQGNHSDIDFRNIILRPVVK